MDKKEGLQEGVTMAGEVIRRYFSEDMFSVIKADFGFLVDKSL